MSEYAPVLDVSTLDGTNGFRIDGDVVGGGSGVSVSFAGDLNSDGVGDLLIGAPQASQAYAVYGQTGAVSGGVLDLGALGAGGVVLSGAGGGDEAGFSVAGAGDVNGDGLQDFMVGADFSDPSGGGNAGSVYVVFGDAGGLPSTVDLTALDGTDGFRLDGVGLNQRLGRAVAAAGDFNHDGIDDLVIGAPGAGSGWTGKAYVLFGTNSGFAASMEVSALDGTNGFEMTGQDGDLAGRSVSSAGDVNGDGFSDVLVGAETADSNNGTTYLVFGHGGAATDPLDLTTMSAGQGVELTTGSALLGSSVSAAGDLNGDGLSDLVIGADGAYSAYVVFGRAGFDGADLGALDGSDGFKVTGNIGTGEAVSGGGDINGDGFDDLVIGGGSGYGSAYVLFGKANGFAASIDLNQLNGDDGFRIDSPHVNDDFGYSVALGDVNGDGLADVIVGAWSSDSAGSDTGSTYVVYGSIPDEAVHRKGSALDQTIHGSNFNDSLAGRSGADHLLGHDGNDRLIGGPGADTLDGGAGFDTAIYKFEAAGVHVDLGLGSATSGADTDVLNSIESAIGSRFADILLGTTDANTLVGGAGDDTIAAGAGDDFIRAGAGADSIIGGDGVDTLSYAGLASAVTVDLDQRTATAAAKIDYIAGVENVIGTSGDDSLTGSNAVNLLVGGKGDDLLAGGRGDDVLVGGIGNDTLDGGRGADVLRGEGGVDTYLYQEIGDSRVGASDDLSEFGWRDVIDLSSIDANVHAAGDQGFTLVSAFDGHAGELTLSFDSGTFQTHVLGDVDGDGTADLDIVLEDSNGTDFSTFHHFVL